MIIENPNISGYIFTILVGLFFIAPLIGLMVGFTGFSIGKFLFGIKIVLPSGKKTWLYQFLDHLLLIFIINPSDSSFSGSTGTNCVSGELRKRLT